MEHTDRQTSEETADAQKPDTVSVPNTALEQLVNANTKIQVDVAERFGSKPDAEAESTLLKAIVNHIPDLVYAKDTHGHFLVANEALARANAIDSVDDLIGKTDFDLFPADIAQGFFDDEQKVIDTGNPLIRGEREITDESGAPKWIQTTKVPMRDESGEIVGLLGMSRDITASKIAENKLEAERTLFRAMIDQVPDYLFVKDTASRFVIANRAVAADFGRKPEELIGKTDFDFHEHKLARKFFADEQNLMRTGKSLIDLEEFVVDFEGNEKWVSSSKVPLRDTNGDIIGIVGVGRDITDRRRAEDRIYFMALHDALTGLPNRTLLMDRLSQGILQADRTGSRLTTIFIDLDNFKTINDSLGHNSGDTLLKVVAERMVATLRASDTVARLGGDEFVILLVDQAEPADPVTSILKKLKAAIAEPIMLEGQPFRVTSSIGVACYPGDGADAESLLLNADIAMYEAKAKGRDNFQFYTKDMDDAARERRLLQDSLRSAMANNEFSLLYQPQINLETGKVFAVEALLRWNHPALGQVSPVKFIPLAEESGLIVPLGDWVLREACRQNKAWQDEGIEPITVCVNVSARQIREQDWVDRVAAILDQTGLAPRYLELELTESMLMQDVQWAVTTMQKLQALGVRFAIDDFGTGYSSLSALKSFPVARLKIDRAFIRNLPYDDNERSIATAVISLGQKLNMRVIAEGVETEDQISFLRENHCDEIQGYHFSRPVLPEAVSRMLRNGSPKGQGSAPVRR